MIRFAILSLVNPTEDMITKWRRESASSGLHSQISHQVAQMLDPDVAREIRGLDIDPLRVIDLRYVFPRDIVPTP